MNGCPSAAGHRHLGQRGPARHRTVAVADRRPVQRGPRAAWSRPRSPAGRRAAAADRPRRGPSWRPAWHARRRPAAPWGRDAPPWPKAPAGSAGTRPSVGLDPTRPVKAAGTRIEPPPSVPKGSRWRSRAMRAGSCSQTSTRPPQERAIPVHPPATVGGELDVGERHPGRDGVVELRAERFRHGREGGDRHRGPGEGPVGAADVAPAGDDDPPGPDLPRRGTDPLDGASEIEVTGGRKLEHPRTLPLGRIREGEGEVLGIDGQALGVVEGAAVTLGDGRSAEPARVERLARRAGPHPSGDRRGLRRRAERHRGFPGDLRPPKEDRPSGVAVVGL